MQQETDWVIPQKPAANRGPSLRSGLHTLLRWLHLQRIVKPIEIIKQSNRRQQLDNLTFIKMFAQLAKELVIGGMRVAGHAFRQP